MDTHTSGKPRFRVPGSGEDEGPGGEPELDHGCFKDGGKARLVSRTASTGVLGHSRGHYLSVNSLYLQLQSCWRGFRVPVVFLAMEASARMARLSKMCGGIRAMSLQGPSNASSGWRVQLVVLR